jgi:hypothetical protein
MKCAPCLIESDPGNHAHEKVPDAVTTVDGTEVCGKCAREVAELGGAGRSVALRPMLMRRQPKRPAQAE